MKPRLRSEQECDAWMRGSTLASATRVNMGAEMGMYIGMEMVMNLRRDDGNVVIKIYGEEPKLARVAFQETSVKVCREANRFDARGKDDLQAAINFVTDHGISDPKRLLPTMLRRIEAQKKLTGP